MFSNTRTAETGGNHFGNQNNERHDTAPYQRTGELKASQPLHILEGLSIKLRETTEKILLLHSNEALNCRREEEGPCL